MATAILFSGNGDKIGEACERGLRRLGYDIQRQVPGPWVPEQAIPVTEGDVVVTSGLRGKSKEAAYFYAAKNAPVAMVDLPHIRRPGYVRLTPPRHDFVPSFTTPNIPTDRLEALNVAPVARKRVRGQSVLIVGQVGYDSAHGMDGATFKGWAAEALTKVRSLDSSKVCWRPHPLDRWTLAGVDEVSDPTTEPFSTAVEHAWLVVTYNSTVGLEALIHGVPVVGGGPSVYRSLAFDFSDWGRIRPPDPEEVNELLAKLSYSQWTVDELEDGACLEYVLSGNPFPGLEVAKKTRPRVAPEASEPSEPVAEPEPTVPEPEATPPAAVPEPEVTPPAAVPVPAAAEPDEPSTVLSGTVTDDEPKATKRRRSVSRRRRS